MLPAAVATEKMKKPTAFRFPLAWEPECSWLLQTCFICPKRCVEAGYLPQKYTSRESLLRSCLRHLSDHSRGKLHYHLYDLFLCGCVGELGQYRLCLLHEGYGQFAFDYLLYPVYVANVFVTKVYLLKCVDGSLSQRCHNHTCDYCVDDTGCEIDSGYCLV